ncbi:MAG TPA: hypothetical protein VHO70_08030 [Chitinispirillaceae bacterium]|nr:hypothetical protein [Chitinispirillaceae bacterium]
MMKEIPLFFRHISFNCGISNIIILLPLLVSPAAASWKAELIDSDTDERLSTTIIHSSGNIVAVGDDNAIVYSDDGGRSWEESEIPDVSRFMESDDLQFLSIVEIPGTRQLLTLGAVNEKHSSGGVMIPSGAGGMIMTPGKVSTEKWTAILISSDGGRRWKLLERIEDAALYWAFTFSDNRCVLLGFSDSLYQFADGEINTIGPTTFTGPEKSFFSFSLFKFNDFSNITDITFRQYKNYLFIVSENKYLAISKDRGATWNQLEGNMKDYDMNTIDIYDKKTILAGCEGGYLQISTDAGLTWTAKKISNQSINDIYVSKTCDWWVAGDDGYLAYSSDLGKSWNTILTTSEEGLRNIKINEDCTEGWICGDDGTLIHIYESRLAKPLSSKNTALTSEEDAEGDDFDGEDDNDDNEISWETRSLKHAQNLYIPLDDSDILYQGIDFEVSPDGATIKIDEQSYTERHLKIPLPPGKHYYRVTKTGYFSEQDSFDIPIGKVEDVSVRLKKIKALISPSGGMSLAPGDMGINFSIMSGILTNKHFCTGAEINLNIMLDYIDQITPITLFFGYSSNTYRKFHILPTVGIGGTRWIETRDSLKIDTTSYVFDDYSSYKDSVEYTVSGTYFTLQASLNFIVKKSSRWGFTWRPSLYWVDQKGFHFAMRFGGIFWI